MQHHTCRKMHHEIPLCTCQWLTICSMNTNTWWRIDCIKEADTHIQVSRTGRVTEGKQRNTSWVPTTLPHLQQRSTMMFSRIQNLGPCHQIKTKHTLNDTRKSIPANTGWTESTPGIHNQTASQRVYLSFKESLCSPFFFHQKEGQQITTCARLPMPQWVDHQEPLPHSPDLWANCQNTKHKDVH